MTPRIAVVGLACRYPDAPDVDALWQTVLARRQTFRPMPESRLSTDYRGDGPDLTYADHAAVLRDWTFDRARFGVPATVFAAADLTHWLALEVAAAALADAGHPDGDGLDRDRVGVVVGNTLTGEFTRAATLRQRLPFIRRTVAAALEAEQLSQEVAAQVLARTEDMIRSTFPEPGDETLAGALSNTIAGRICNVFDFHGTGFTVDGACASSLVSVATACQALVAGDVSFALAGGVDLSLDPFELVGFSRLGAVARGSQMRVYDSHPTGFLPGEGCGMVALQRAEDAERAGARVYGYITGWGQSSDGAGGLTRPASSGQLTAMRRAYARAATEPGSARLHEGHGTGTAVGDAVELEALSRLRHGASGWAGLGSVKANIGHTKAAAGVAGLIKLVLAVHHRVVPPTTGCVDPHPALGAAGSTLRVLDQPEPWPDRVPVGSVAASGFGGINVHLVVSGAPGDPTRLSRTVQRWSGGPVSAAVPVLVAARSAEELVAELRRVEAAAPRLSLAELRDLGAHLASRHSGSTARLRAGALVTTGTELAAQAALLAERVTSAGVEGLTLERGPGTVLAGGRLRLGLLLPGQASPVRCHVPRWATALDVPPVPGWLKGRDGELDTAVVQVAVTAQSLFGLAWLQHLGAQADAALGHSLGEVAALCWGGALTQAQALQVAEARGRLMADRGAPGTTMASIGAAASEVAGLLDPDPVVVAALNGPRSTVVAGPAPAVQAVLARARAHGWASSLLPVSHAFHSPAMAAPARALRELLRTVTLAPVRRPVVSTVTGTLLRGDADLVDELVTQLTSPVLFTDACRELAARTDLLVEVGPGHVLTGLAAACGDTPALSLDCGGDEATLAYAALVLAAGQQGDLTAWFGDSGHRPINLDAEPRFLANPCEVDLGEALPVAPRAAPAPATVPEPAGPARTEVVADVTAVAADAGEDPVGWIREHLAGLLDLPLRAVRADSSLLGDLHLSSLKVTEVVATLAQRSGRVAPAAPLSLSDATVADVAAVLSRLPTSDGAAVVAERPRPVEPWVAAFVHDWVPAPAPHGLRAARWTVWPPTAAAGPLSAWLPRGDGEPALAVRLGDDRPATLADAMREIVRSAWAQLLVLHDGRLGAAALARSAARELTGCEVTVLDCAELGLDDLDPRQVGGPGRLTELRRCGGEVHRATTRVGRLLPVPDRVPPGLSAGHVLLVTGGATGISALLASAIAERAGARLAVLGRRPGDDAGVVAALRGLRARVETRYLQTDVTDPRSVEEALDAARAWGPVGGLVHGAGVNTPRLMERVDAASLSATLAPKVDGLRLLLQTLEGRGVELALCLGLGSIIGRSGLAGQSEYAVANDMLSQLLSTWAAAHPGCRTHSLEWSVWSGAGMGVDLGVLDDLARQGVDPISPAQGEEALLAVLGTPDLPVCLTLASRVPDGMLWHLPEPAPVTGRFTERLRTAVDGVEAVYAAELSLGADPYLADHRIDGSVVLPAVVGLEAMAQAAGPLLAPAGDAPTGTRSLELRGLTFDAPILLDQPRELEIAVLAQADEVLAAVRSDVDQGLADRFRGRVARGPAERPTPVATVEPPADLGAGPHPFYGSVLFHEGRFRAVRDVAWLTAARVEAWIDPGPARGWFDAFHDPDLRLGSPAQHDATLHVLLACLPHRRALPVALDAVTFWSRTGLGPLRVVGQETSHGDGRYRYDLVVSEPDGTVVSVWRGLTLAAVAPVPETGPGLAQLVGPWLSRRAEELDVAEGLHLCVAPGERPGGAGPLMARLAGQPVEHLASGRPVVARGHVTASYAGGHVLAGFSAEPLGVDLEVVRPRPAQAWQDLLGPRGWALARSLADKTGESADQAATRAWTLGEAVRKLGRPPEATVQLDVVGPDDAVVLTGGGSRLLSTLVQTAELGWAAAAVAVQDRER